MKINYNLYSPKTLRIPALTHPGFWVLVVGTHHYYHAPRLTTDVRMLDSTDGSGYIYPDADFPLQGIIFRSKDY